MSMFVFLIFVFLKECEINCWKKEYSARYSVMKDEFFKPEKEDIKQQSSTNKQGTSCEMVSNSTASEFLDYLNESEIIHYKKYMQFIEKGVSREQARMILPVNIYTEWYWKCDLHNIFNFLSLRMDSHAQKEIRVFADAMFELVKTVFPIACQAFLDYRMGCVSLTRLELEAIKNKINTLSINNKRENKEYQDKLKKMQIKFE